MPAVHAAPPPATLPEQRHCPFAQLSAFSPHAIQAAPALPHSLRLGTTHLLVLPEQQPLQLAESHTQVPPTHLSPTLHAALTPHLQLPPVQLSATTPQLVHKLPPLPQLPAVGDETQAPLKQQPLGQLAAVQPEHCWPVQVCGEGQLWHILPPPPHSLVAVPALHTSPKQQPEGHDSGVHLHTPPTQRCVEGQAVLLLPHTQWPSWHWSAKAESQVLQALPPNPHAPSSPTLHWSFSQQPLGHDPAVQRHWPPTHTWPALHSALVPQAQLPSVQVSAVGFTQLKQVSPPLPHCALLGALHSPLKQHPEGQFSALQPEQVPSLHV
ncbi:MAG: hypothetical protein K1X64_12835 [Myxococcaceae bacterium]|nr:hypothetical protein [Myxococcaceae bacterium]